MDFSLDYTEKQEEFAREVREWLERNVPEGLVFTRDPCRTSYEQWQKRRAFGRKLAQVGWLWPGYPVKYGGGSLDAAHCFVLHEELGKRGLSLPPYYDAATLAIPAILARGSEEQKKRFLPPMLKGEVTTWQLFTEPEAGTDEANQQTNALRYIRDRDHFVINGQKIFVGSTHYPPEQFLLLTRSDLDAQRHKNLAMFLAPANLPGITIQPLDLFPATVISLINGPAVDAASGTKHSVFFDDVRVHQSFLIGGEKDGWGVTTAALLVEHGEGGAGGGKILRNVMVEKFLGQCRNNQHMVKRIRENPQLINCLVRVYIDAQIERLLAMRNAWLPSSGRRVAYAGPQLGIYSKMFGSRFIAEMAEILGPYSLVNEEEDEWLLDEAIFEVGQRCGICLAPGGTPEALKIAMSRALGIGR